jgi:hypothetical protein
MLLLRALPLILELGLLIYCLIDLIQTPEDEVRNLPKIIWVFLIIFLPLIGGIAWLVAGRPPKRSRSRAAWPSGPTAGFPEYERPGRSAPVGPDDDPAFLSELRQVNDEHEQTLQRWEEDLRRREEQLRDGPDDEGTGTAGGKAKPEDPDTR